MRKTSMAKQKDSLKPYFSNRSQSTMYNKSQKQNEMENTQYTNSSVFAFNRYRKGEMMQHLSLSNPNQFISRTSSNLKNYYQRKE